MLTAMKHFLVVLLLAAFALAEDPATLRVYRYSMAGGNWRAAKVWMNNSPVTKVNGGHYVDLPLAAGQHTFRGSYKGQKLVIDAKPGTIYFLRVDCGAPDGFHYIVCAVDPATGAAETAALKPQK